MPTENKIEEEEVDFPAAELPGSILVAEDSVLYRHVITGHLKKWGFDFVCARDGEEAWKLLMKKDAPRLALLDWVLPEIDGVELCRRLRERSEDEPYTYTILLTSKNRQEEKFGGKKERGAEVLD